MTIRVLIADDSALMRRAISDFLSSDPTITVIGTANNGRVLIEKTRNLLPDVIVTDITMPEMDGLTAVREIMKECPRPIIVVSAASEQDSALAAMSAGAVDFIAKPSGEISLDLDKIRGDIVAKVKLASLANIPTHIAASMPVKVKNHRFHSTTRKLIVIGASTGGPPAIERVLRELPANTPAPILIVQHMPPDFTRSLAERLNAICDIRVREAKDYDALEDGVALIAPGGFHMVLVGDREDAIIRLTTDAPELSVRPSVNKLFRSAAPIYRENIIGVVLTGMGSDGKEGAHAIKQQLGTVIAEAEESCTIFGMPKEVINAGYADEVVRLEQMAVALLQLLDI